MNAPAFLALWNGVDTAQVSLREYETWHSYEHVPERVGLPGRPGQVTLENLDQTGAVGRQVQIGNEVDLHESVRPGRGLR